MHMRIPLHPGNPSFSGASWPRAGRRNARAEEARVSFTSVGALIFVTVHQPAYRAHLSAFLIVSGRLCHAVHLVGAGSRWESPGAQMERGGWTFGLGTGHDVALLPSGNLQWSFIIVGDLEFRETMWPVLHRLGIIIFCNLVIALSSMRIDRAYEREESWSAKPSRWSTTTCCGIWW